MGVTLYLLRHGQTDFSRENSFCGSGLDPELTDEGREMAEQFAAAYVSFPWAALYSSTLQRTRQTVAPLAEKTGLPVEYRSELVEIGYGQWEGQTVEIALRDFHDDYIRWTADPAWNAPSGGGETAVAVAHRAQKVVEEIQARFPSGNVLIVSHKATIRILLCTLLGMDVGRFRSRIACPVASVSIVEFGHSGPLLKALADRSHLSETLRELPGT